MTLVERVRAARLRARSRSKRVAESRKLDPAKVRAECMRQAAIRAAAVHGIPDFVARLYQEPDDKAPVAQRPRGTLTAEKMLAELRQV